MTIISQDSDQIVHEHIIKVVKYHGALMFELEGLKFDVINPEYMLWQGDGIKVVRNGQHIDSARIEWRGTHDACLTICGLTKINLMPNLPRFHYSNVTEEIYPVDFQVGDELHLQWSIGIKELGGTQACILHNLPLHWRIQLLGASPRTAKIRRRMHPHRYRRAA